MINIRESVRQVVPSRLLEGFVMGAPTHFEKG